MASLIVGDQDCKFATVAKLALKYSHVKENWTVLARALNCNYTTISEIRRNISLKLYGPEDAIESVLVHWRSRESTKATLIKLIHSIETYCKWKDFSDDLKEAFKVSSTPKKTQLSDEFVIFTELSIFVGQGWEVFQGQFGKYKKKSAVKKVPLETRYLCIEKIEKLGPQFADQNTPAIYVLEYFGMLEYEKYLYISVEFGKQSLYDIIQVGENMSSKIRIQYLFDATRGLDWLHRREIVHGNIKPENILIGSRSSGNIAKLADFWLPRYTPSNKIEAEGNWMSPEEILFYKDNVNPSCRYKETVESDIYSLGIVYFYTLSWGEHPNENRKLNLENEEVVKTQKPQVNPFLDDEFPCCNLLYWMLQKNVEDRSKMNHIVSHPMFWSNTKCYRFLKQVSKYYQSNSMKKDILNFFSDVDKAYMAAYNKSYLYDFSWFVQIEKRLFIRNSDTNTKTSFDTKSIMSLICFFENCDIDRNSLDDGVVADLFSDDNGKFDSTKYTQYFLNEFPEMLIIIFAAISTNRLVSQDKKLSPFVDKFLERKDFMHDPFVYSFVSQLLTDKQGDD